MSGTTQSTTPEYTATVVIGSGFSGLAVASELDRYGHSPVVLDASCLWTRNGRKPVTGSLAAVSGPDASAAERGEIMRLLRHYVASHQVDVRLDSSATTITPLHDSRGSWLVRTPQGELVAENLVFTQCALSGLRSFLASNGVRFGAGLPAAIKALGIYLVGVGHSLSQSTKDVFREAKLVSQAISERLAGGAGPAVAGVSAAVGL